MFCPQGSRGSSVLHTQFQEPANVYSYCFKYDAMVEEDIMRLEYDINHMHAEIIFYTPTQPS